MKILSLSVLAGVVAAPASACDLCSVYSATQARGELGKGFYSGVAEQFSCSSICRSSIARSNARKVLRLTAGPSPVSATLL